MSNNEHTEAAHMHKDPMGARMGMWIFLFTELLLFGGLFFAYSVYRYLHHTDFHQAAMQMNTFLGTLNTIILLTSSMTMALSIAAMQRGKKILSIVMQLVTILLGAQFLVNKYFEWSAEFARGNYPGSPTLIAKGSGQTLYYGLYYTMVGLHGLHVIVGMTVITFMLVFTIRGTINKDDYTKLENAGLYWHLVDIIWIFLYPLFYLIT